MKFIPYLRIMIAASLPFHAAAQTVQWKVPFLCTSKFPRTDTLWIGISGDGPDGIINDNTHSIDYDLSVFGPTGNWSEDPFPPDPPMGALFLVKFVDVPGDSTIARVCETGMGPYNFHGFSSVSQIDTFAFIAYGDSINNGPFTLTWPGNLRQYANSWRLEKRKMDNSFETVVADMTATTSYSDPNVTFRYALRYLLIVGSPMTSVHTPGSIPPSTIDLGQNYPNPFNPRTIIPFTVSRTDFVQLTVYNLLGQEIGKLYHGIAVGGTLYEVEFDGQEFPSGLYFYRITGTGRYDIKKMTLLK